MVGLWVPVNGQPMGNNKKTFSGGTEGQGDGKMGGVPPEKVWWPPVLLIFYFITRNGLNKLTVELFVVLPLTI